MKDIAEASVAVTILGIGLSITIPAIASGKLFSLGTGTTPADFTLSVFIAVWGLAAVSVGSVYVAFRIWRSLRIH